MASKSTKRVPKRRNHTTAHGKTKNTPKKTTGRWSARVMQRSDALDLEGGVFKKSSARQIALSLKRSAESSRRRKSSPFRSAMSMLNFEINRGGKTLSASRRQVLNRTKEELRKVFHREPGKRPSSLPG